MCSPFNLREQVALLAATELEEQGNNLDALTFYHMANNQTKVLAILCKTISDALQQFYFSSTPSIFSTIQHAKSILEFYSSTTTTIGNGRGTNETASSWFSRITQLLAFFEALKSYHEKQYEQVFVALQSAKLWPQPALIPSLSNTKSQEKELVSFWNFGHLLLTRHLTRLLQVYMDSLQWAFKELQKPKRLLYESQAHILKVSLKYSIVYHPFISLNPFLNRKWTN